MSTLLAILLLAVTPSFAVVPSDIVKTWPGTNTTDWGFSIYSGYLDLQYTGGKKTHYVLAESKSQPSADPLVLWFTGGPGCSSLNAFSYENGPFFF